VKGLVSPHTYTLFSSISHRSCEKAGTDNKKKKEEMLHHHSVQTPWQFTQRKAHTQKKKMPNPLIVAASFQSLAHLIPMRLFTERGSHLGVVHTQHTTLCRG
jgi:hypothetical protein